MSVSLQGSHITHTSLFFQIGRRFWEIWSWQIGSFAIWRHLTFQASFPAGCGDLGVTGLPFFPVKL